MNLGTFVQNFSRIGGGVLQMGISGVKAVNQPAHREEFYGVEICRVPFKSVHTMKKLRPEFFRLSSLFATRSGLEFMFQRKILRLKACGGKEHIRSESPVEGTCVDMTTSRSEFSFIHRTSSTGKKCAETHLEAGSSH